MNKWIAIPVIAVLAIAVIGGGYFLWQQTSKLGEAQSEIVALEGNVSTLEGNVLTLEGNVSTLEGTVSTLEGNVSTLEADLTESEATVTTLEADLDKANDDIQTQRTLNSTLSAELKTVKDPRHFASLSELTDWLQKDDTDTKYGEQYEEGKSMNPCYILQVRALRDGFLLPAACDEEGGILYFYNLAILDGDEVYGVIVNDDRTIELGTLAYGIPSHPLP